MNAFVCVVSDTLRTGQRKEFYSFHRYRAAGFDKVIAASVTEGMGALGPYVRNIYRVCLAHLYIAITWHDMKMIFISKPGVCV